MACPTGVRFTAQMFETAIENLDLWQAGFCGYGTPLGELVVGSVLYGGIALNIFIRTGSLIIPFVLFLILGGTIAAQMFAIISTFGGLVIMLVAPAIVTIMVYMWDRY